MSAFRTARRCSETPFLPLQSHLPASTEYQDQIREVQRSATKMVCKYYRSQGETHSSLAAEERLIVRSMEPESEIINNPNLPKCHACKLSFMSKEQLEQHKKDPCYHLVCEQCIIEFHTEEGLRRHKLQVSTSSQT